MKGKKWFQKKEFWMAFFIVIAVSLIIYGIIVEVQEFDAEKHHCTLESTFYVKVSDMMLFINSDESKGASCELQPFDSVYKCNRCVEWRDKTYCKLHPEDDEKCVCEEYKFPECPNGTVAYYQTNCRYIYTYDDQGHTVIFNDNPCLNAREKSIEDLTCDELEDHYLNGNPCTAKGGFFDHQCVAWKYPMRNGEYQAYPDNEIMLFMLKKGYFSKTFTQGIIYHNISDEQGWLGNDKEHSDAFFEWNEITERLEYTETYADCCGCANTTDYECLFDCDIKYRDFLYFSLADTSTQEGRMRFAEASQWDDNCERRIRERDVKRLSEENDSWIDKYYACANDELCFKACATLEAAA